MENEFIDLRKYPECFWEAIHQQDRIRWNHLIAGKISQAWLQMYKDTYVKPRSSGTHHRPEGFVWGRSPRQNYPSKYDHLLGTAK